MSGSPGNSHRHYSAFISYTDKDRARVLRLQSRLESYRFPGKLADRLGYAHIKPVCVDRSEMRAASDLGDVIRDAIGHSDFLIVACTPNTPSSYWVGQEIDAFRAMHGDDRILVALLEGEKQDSFHPRLLVGQADRTIEPLAANFQKQGDGYRLALLKILASIADVDLEELVQRDSKRQRSRRLRIGALAIAVSTLIALSAYRAHQSSIALDNERIRASEAMQRQLEELRQEVREGGTLNMEAAINRNVEKFYLAQPVDIDLPEVEIGRSQLLHSIAQTDIQRRDLASAEENARAAWQITSSLYATESGNAEVVYAHAQSAFWVGYAAWLRRDTPLAAAFFSRYAQLADELVAANPENIDYILEQGFAYSNFGTIALREARDPDAARSYFQSSQAAFREVVRRNPQDTETLLAIADGESWLADVAESRGDYEASQHHREEQLRLLEDLLRDDPRNKAYRIVYLSSRTGQARMEASRGNYRDALMLLQEAETEAEELLSSDPQNPSLTERKRIIELFQARTELEIGTSGAIRRAEDHIGDCGKDWMTTPDGELPVFCSLLKASLAFKRGQTSLAREIMVDQRLAEWFMSPSLTPSWRLDLQEECRKMGVTSLCETSARTR